MSFFSFIKNNEFKSGLALALDVGGGSVGVSIVNLIESKNPEILFSHRKQLPVQLKLSNHRMLPIMSGVLDDVLSLAMDKLVLLKDLNKGKPLHISKIFCTISSPWNIDSTKSISFSFQKPVLIDKNFLKDLIERESSQFLRSLAKEDHDVYGDPKHFELIEKSFSHAFINGYDIKNIFGRVCSDLEIFIFFSAISKEVEKTISRICGKHFVGAHIEFHSAVFAHTSVLEKMFPEEKDFMLTHISGETTDITVVKNGIVTDNASFPLGRNFIARKILDVMPGLTPNLVLSMVRVHYEKNTNPKLSDKLQVILKQAEEDWMSLFSDSVAEISKEFFMPSKAFILIGDGSARLFSDLINSKKIPVFGRNPYTINAEAFEVELFLKMVDFHTGTEKDPFLSAQAIFLHNHLFNNYRF
jgi:hypothetical protein